MKIRTTQLLAAGAVLALATGTASAATLVLTGNETDSDASGFSFAGITATTNDGFAYDQDDPTSVLPDMNFNNGNTSVGFHGNEPNGQDVDLFYDLPAFTTTASESGIVVDLYTRNNAETESDRDNNIDVVLLNGVTVVATVSGLAAPDTGIAHVRATFDSLALGTTFDRIHIIGHDSGDAASYFSLAEIRAASVPEPGSLALLGLGGLLIARRRRS